MANALLDFRKEQRASLQRQAELSQDRNFRSRQAQVNRDQTFAQQDKATQQAQEDALARILETAKQRRGTITHQEELENRPLIPLGTETTPESPPLSPTGEVILQRLKEMAGDQGSEIAPAAPVESTGMTEQQFLESALGTQKPPAQVIPQEVEGQPADLPKTEFDEPMADAVESIKLADKLKISKLEEIAAIDSGERGGGSQTRLKEKAALRKEIAAIERQKENLRKEYNDNRRERNRAIRKQNQDAEKFQNDMIKEIIKNDPTVDVGSLQGLTPRQLQEELARSEQTKAARDIEKQAIEKLTVENIKSKGELKEKQTNFGRTVAAFSQIVAQAKAMKHAQSGLGILPGLKGKMMVLAERFMGTEGEGKTGAITAFKGQLFETALSLNNILTGQNRVIEGVLNHILGTLPEVFDTEGQMASKIKQSVENAFRIQKAFEKFGWDKNFFDALDQGQDTITSINESMIRDMASTVVLTEEDKAEADKIVNQVLQTKRAAPASFEGVGSTEIDQTPLSGMGLDSNRFEIIGVE